MQANVDNYKQVNSLPDFRLFTVFFVVPGVLLVLLAGIGLFGNPFARGLIVPPPREADTGIEHTSPLSGVNWRERARRRRSHPLPDELVELIAERFRALAEPTRIKLLDRLREGEATVLELTALVGTTQQNVSKHLVLLQRAGIVARRKQGNFAYYRIADETRLRPVRSRLRQPVDPVRARCGVSRGVADGRA